MHYQLIDRLSYEKTSIQSFNDILQIDMGLQYRQTNRQEARERQTEIDKQRQRDRQREVDRQTKIQRLIDKDRKIKSDRQIDKGRQTNKDRKTYCRQRQIDRKRDRQIGSRKAMSHHTTGRTPDGINFEHLSHGFHRLSYLMVGVA